MDQAHQLRRLVQDVSRTAAPSQPALALLLSGKTGVGTTTLSVNLAAALAEQGRRTVLVDADAQGGNLALRCGLDDSRSMADVVAGRLALAEVLQPGPAGMLVAPGAWGLDMQAEGAPSPGYDWIEQLRALGSRADVVLLDGGAGVSRTVERLLQTVDAALVAAAPDAEAIVSAYALIKTIAAANPRLRVQCLVNRAADADTARQVLDRIMRASVRFLGVRPRLAGYVPSTAALEAPGFGLPPLVESDPECEAAQQLRRIAKQIADEWVDRRAPLVFQARLSGAEDSFTAQTDLSKTNSNQET